MLPQTLISPSLLVRVHSPFLKIIFLLHMAHNPPPLPILLWYLNSPVTPFWVFNFSCDASMYVTLKINAFTLFFLNVPVVSLFQRPSHWTLEGRWKSLFPPHASLRPLTPYTCTLCFCPRSTRGGGSSRTVTGPSESWTGASLDLQSPVSLQIEFNSDSAASWLDKCMVLGHVQEAEADGQLHEGGPSTSCSHVLPIPSLIPGPGEQKMQNKFLLNKWVYVCVIIKQHGNYYNRDAKCNQSIEEAVIYF